MSPNKRNRTGATKSIYKVVPAVEGIIDGLAMRVPVNNISIIDLTAVLKRDTTLAEINDTFKRLAETELKGILGYETRLLVSDDYIGNPHSSVLDAQLTQVVNLNHIKILSWYDNEIVFANRMIDQIEFCQKQGL